MNDTLRVLKERRSCRKYINKQIDKNIINEIVEAGTYAPTGMNKQSPFIVVVQNEELIKKIGNINGSIIGESEDPFYGAPTVLIVFADSKIPTYLHDGNLVMGNLMNAAYSLGVDSCYIYRAKETFETEEGKTLMKEWGLPSSCVGIGNCILGYGAEGGKRIASKRKENYVIWAK